MSEAVAGADALSSEAEVEKKTYVPPVITEYGDAVHLTRGLGGRFWESFMSKMVSDLDTDPPPKDDENA
jgi:hypothetical protein